MENYCLALEKKLYKIELIKELKRDDRLNASKFYKAYLLTKKARSFIKSSNLESEITDLISSLREKKDALLINELEIELLKLYSFKNKKYITLSQKVYSKNKSSLYNSGLKFPINTSNFTADEIELLNSTAFNVFNNEDLKYKLGIIRKENEVEISFYNNSRLVFKFTGESFENLLPKIIDKVFVNRVYGENKD